MNKKDIDNWIHGRVVLETEGRDVIIKPKPVEGEAPPTGSMLRFRLTDSQVKVLMNHGDIPGPKQLAAELGLRRVLSTAKVVGGATLIGAANAMIKGVPWPLALATSAMTTAGSALVAGVIKSNKELGKQGESVSNWKILGGIILEILKLIRAFIPKEKKK